MAVVSAGSARAWASAADFPSYGGGYTTALGQCGTDLEALGATIKYDRDPIPIPPGATDEQIDAIKADYGKRQIVSIKFDDPVKTQNHFNNQGCYMLDANGCPKYKPDTDSSHCYDPLNETFKRLGTECGTVNGGGIDCHHARVYTSCSGKPDSTTGPGEKKCSDPSKPLMTPEMAKYVKHPKPNPSANPNPKPDPVQDGPLISTELPCGKVCMYTATVTVAIEGNEIGKKSIRVACEVEKGGKCPPVKDCMNPSKGKLDLKVDDPSPGTGSGSAKVTN